MKKRKALLHVLIIAVAALILTGGLMGCGILQIKADKGTIAIAKAIGRRAGYHLAQAKPKLAKGLEGLEGAALRETVLNLVIDDNELLKAELKDLSLMIEITDTNVASISEAALKGFLEGLQMGGGP